MTDKKHVEMIGAGMLFLMILGTITAVGRATPSDAESEPDDARKVASLEARIDIEHAEREGIAHRLSEIEAHVEDLYNLDDSQATGIMLLEQDLTELIEGRKAREAWPAQSFAMGLEVGE